MKRLLNLLLLFVLGTASIFGAGMSASANGTITSDQGNPFPTLIQNGNLTIGALLTVSGIGFNLFNTTNAYVLTYNSATGNIELQPATGGGGGTPPFNISNFTLNTLLVGNGTGTATFMGPSTGNLAGWNMSGNATPILLGTGLSMSGNTVNVDFSAYLPVANFTAGNLANGTLSIGVLGTNGTVADNGNLITGDDLVKWTGSSNITTAGALVATSFAAHWGGTNSEGFGLLTAMNSHANATLIGDVTQAFGDNLTTVGYNSYGNTNGTVLGANSHAGNNSIVVGDNAHAGDGDISIGHGIGVATTNNGSIVVISNSAQRAGNLSFIVGGTSGTQGIQTVDIDGSISNPFTNISHTIIEEGTMTGSNDSSDSVILLGNDHSAGNYTGDILIGNSSIFASNYSIQGNVTAVGQSDIVWGFGGIALGQYAFAQGHSAMALGDSTSANGPQSTAIGYGTIADFQNEYAAGGLGIASTPFIGGSAWDGWQADWFQLFDDGSAYILNQQQSSNLPTVYTCTPANDPAIIATSSGMDKRVKIIIGNYTAATGSGTAQYTGYADVAANGTITDVQTLGEAPYNANETVTAYSPAGGTGATFSITNNGTYITGISVTGNGSGYPPTNTNMGGAPLVLLVGAGTGTAAGGGFRIGVSPAGNTTNNTPNPEYDAFDVLPSSNTSLPANATVNGTLTVNSNLKAANYIGTNTTGNATAGGIGEYMEANSTTSTTTGNVIATANITLTPGDWDVTGDIEWNMTATTGSDFIASFSTSDSSLGPYSASQIYVPGPFTTFTDVYQVAMPTQRFSVSTNTTIYLNTEVTFASGAVAVTGYIRARRMR